VEAQITHHDEKVTPMARAIYPKELRELLSAVRVFNDYNLIGVQKHTPIVDYRSREKWLSPAWQVWLPGHKTDPKAHWQDHGNKTFIVYGQHDKDETFAEARAWAEARFGPITWVKTPYGAWTNEAWLRQRLTELLGEEVAGRVKFTYLDAAKKEKTK
jgi:hypothetical protein